MSSNHLMVAAIDFGTTYSGYAFSMRGDFKEQPLNINANQSWNAGSKQLLSLKTPTVLLLDKNKTFLSFGYDAENQYTELMMDEEHEEYYYFHRFKMKLHKNMPLSTTSVIEDITGKSTLALVVFSLSIQALKDELMETIHQRGLKMTVKDIRWVITVPAIWTDAAKQFMRKSAEKAGIPGENLLIALEPEAASIYCQYLPTEKLNGAEEGFTMSEVGTKYMIIDLGGGTADMTVHEKQENEKLKELCQATGDACGGTSIDNEFFQLLVKIVGGPLMYSLSKDNPSAYLDLFREFETIKRTIYPNKSGKVNFTIPFVAIDTLCQKNFGEGFKSTVSSCSMSDNISLRHDKMRADADVLKALFSKSMVDIVGHVSNLIKQCEGISMLLLVGGFSESEMLHHAIRKEFPDKRIIIPEDAGLSVLKGAVLFGHKPDYISSRVMRYTYGIGTRLDFNRNIHDQTRLVIIDGKEMCKKCFWPIIKSNQTTAVGTKVRNRLHSTKKFEKRLVLPVYASHKESPMYIDEPGCVHIGTVYINIPNPSENTLYINVEFYFGNTELTVTTTVEGTGHTETAKFDLV
ncbi:heat shock 70 kDa protein 12B-like isoform X3 [Mytilus californianus]|uniref:heat shock 70 kDa protein 12B-like isoform X3 n=1 Tax=Mytilus californianus TaxID=6549 RepID=UPI0022482DE9|nr:heat shock 70 kDa protein 12B-like isoform X3 [Mytilus californianus]